MTVRPGMQRPLGRMSSRSAHLSPELKLDPVTPGGRNLYLLSFDANTRWPQDLWLAAGVTRTVRCSVAVAWDMVRQLRRRSTPQRVLVLTLTEPEVVPITPEQYLQAIYLLAAMIDRYVMYRRERS